MGVFSMVTVDVEAVLGHAGGTGELGTKKRKQKKLGRSGTARRGVAWCVRVFGREESGMKLWTTPR